ncbi:Dbl homology domain-containing protein, partial [Caulochytrium protostelioides]
GVDRQGCFRIATIQSATGGRGEDELARTLLHLAILATEKYHVTVPGFQLAVAHEALAKCHAASETSGSSETQPGSASSPKPLRARHSTMAAESPVSGSNHSIASHATGHGAHGGTSAHAGAGAAAHGLTAASSLPSSSQRRAKAQEAMRLKFQSIADYVNRDLAALTKRLNDIEALQIAVAMALQTQQTTPSPQVAMLLTHLADAASENNGVGEGDEDDEDDDVSVCRMADSDADGLAINTLQESTPKTSASPNASPQAASTPKVFKAVPEELLNAGLPKIELLRLSAVYELIETEADYVRDLGIMIDFYKTQIRQTQMVTEEELSILFSNVDQLVGPNQGLLRTLNTAKEANNRLPEVGPCLIECAEAFTVYTTYCGNYQTAMKLLSNLQARPEFKEHLNRWMASPSSRGLSLESFLIKPVQRICKYPLIVREIQRHTDAQSPDQALLTTAMAKVEAVVSVVNEATRALGERERLAGLQARIEAPFNLGLTERKVLRDGPLSRFASGKSRERYVIACADILLICKPKEKGRYTLEDLYANHELS